MRTYAYIEPVKLILESCPVCGCGNPKLSYELFRKWLCFCKKMHQEPTPILKDDPLLKEVYTAINSGGDLEGCYGVINEVLDLNGCTEHGSNWHGSWLTKKGEDLLLALEYAKDFEYDFNVDIDGWCVEEVDDGKDEEDLDA